MAQARAHVIYSGRVQGVGFRYTASHLASGRPVTGWVRNLGNGAVELEAQGERPQVEAYLDGLRAAMHGYIERAEVDWVPPAQGESGFGVRF